MNSVFQKLADISTAHLTEDTCNKYLKDESCPICAYEFDYGWFVTTPIDVDEFKGIIPQDLFDCLAWAKRNKVDIVKFDCDAEVIDGLTHYDW